MDENEPKKKKGLRIGLSLPIELVPRETAQITPMTKNLEDSTYADLLKIRG